MKTYLYIGYDVKIHRDGSVCRVFHKGKGIYISNSPSWVYSLLLLLQHPISQENLEILLNEEPYRNGKELLLFLEERGIIIRSLAENENIALFHFYNKRSLKGRKLHSNYNVGAHLPLGPPLVSNISLASALRNRYSCSEATSIELTPEKLSILLALTYGSFPSETGIMRRAVPAAGGLYPLLVFLCLSGGDNQHCYQYVPEYHRLDMISYSRVRIRDLCNDQEITDQARALVIFVYDVEKNTVKYGPRGLQFALIECGHAAQNLILGAAGVGIGTRCIGAITFEIAQEVCALKLNQVPLYGVALY